MQAICIPILEACNKQLIYIKDTCSFQKECGWRMGEVKLGTLLGDLVLAGGQEKPTIVLQSTTPIQGSTHAAMWLKY
jgi:hypothetical protein